MFKRNKAESDLKAKVDVLWDIIKEMDKTRSYNDDLSQKVDITITGVYKDMFLMEDRLKKVIQNGIFDITSAISELDKTHEE